MSRVAQAAGIRKASLYHHFASKEDLFLAALSADVAGPLNDVIALSTQHDVPADERFLVGLGLFHDAMVGSSIGAMATVISETSQKFPAVAEGFHAGFIVPFETALGRLYADAVADGARRRLRHGSIERIVFGPLLTSAMTEAMFASAPHLIEETKIGRDRAEFVAMIDELTDRNTVA